VSAAELSQIILAIAALAGLFTALWGKRLETAVDRSRVAADAEDKRQGRELSESEVSAQILQSLIVTIKTEYESEHTRRKAAEQRNDEYKAAQEAMREELKQIKTQLSFLVKELAGLPILITAGCPVQGVACPARRFADAMGRLIGTEKLPESWEERLERAQGGKG
jgi:septal ring factor EnvC (AmiA/AmiB activator)